MSDALLFALAHNHRPPPSSQFWFAIVDDRPPPTIADIRAAVARHYGVTKSDMTSNRRCGAQLARQVAMYLCRRLTEHSHEVISRGFNKCDHTASLRAYRTISAAMKSSDEFAETISELEARFA